GPAAARADRAVPRSEDRRGGAVEVPHRRARRGRTDRGTDPRLRGAGGAGRARLPAPGDLRVRHAAPAGPPPPGGRRRVRLPRRAAAPAAGLDAARRPGVAVAARPGTPPAVAPLPAPQPRVPDPARRPDAAGMAPDAATTGHRATRHVPGLTPLPLRRSST